MHDYMALHKWSEFVSSSGPQSSDRKQGQWSSTVDLEGHEKGKLCNLKRLSWWTVLSCYFILRQWHHISPFLSDVRLSSGWLWKIETADMQPVDWASVFCISGINERGLTHKLACSAVRQGRCKEADASTLYWEHHYNHLLTATSWSHFWFSEGCGWKLMLLVFCWMCIFCEVGWAAL